MMGLCATPQAPSHVARLDCYVHASEDHQEGADGATRERNLVKDGRDVTAFARLHK